MAYGQVTSSSGRVLNLTPAGWINNEGQNLNDAPMGNALQAAMQQQPQQPQPASNRLMEAASAPSLSDFLEANGTTFKNKVDYNGKQAFIKPDGSIVWQNPDGSTGVAKIRSPQQDAYDASQRALVKDEAALDHVRAQTESLRRTDTAKPPPGYKMTQEGNLQAIPGGPADLKQQGAFNQDTAALSGSTNSMDRLASAANEALSHPGLSGITGVQSMFPNMPGGKAADAQAKLNTLRSQVGFGVLQDMRNNSKTGGALGSVSDAEGKRLEANLAALENAQSEAQMKDSLRKIIEYTGGAKDRLRGAYNMRHGDKVQPSSQPAQLSGGYSDPAKEQRYQQWLQSQGR